MDHDERMEFNECLNRMFYLFSSVAKVNRDEGIIQQYIESHDKAKNLLSDSSKSDSECCVTKD